MTLKELVLSIQLDSLANADIGPGASSLEKHRDLWSMLYYGHDTLIVFPIPGKEDDLSELFRWSLDGDRPYEIWADEVSWEEVEGKRYIRAWWD